MGFFKRCWSSKCQSSRQNGNFAPKRSFIFPETKKGRFSQRINQPETGEKIWLGKFGFLGFCCFYWSTCFFVLGEIELAKYFGNKFLCDKMLFEIKYFVIELFDIWVFEKVLFEVKHFVIELSCRFGWFFLLCVDWSWTRGRLVVVTTNITRLGN